MIGHFYKNFAASGMPLYKSITDGTGDLNAASTGCPPCCRNRSNGHWLRPGHRSTVHDWLFRLYTGVLSLEHGNIFNGNGTPSDPAVRATMQLALKYNLELACRVQP